MLKNFCHPTYNADGNVSSITAVNASTGNQTTRYVYGTTLADSDIAASTLKRAEIYPDSDDTADPLGDGPDELYDRIEFQYNRRRELIETQDQNGTVHAYDYGKLGVDHGRWDRSFRENWSVRGFSLKNASRPKHRSCWGASADRSAPMA